MNSGAGFKAIGRKGDLTVYLTTVQFPGDHDEHSALYLRNENRKDSTGGCPAFLLPLRDFWHFRPEDRDRGKFASYASMHSMLANAAVALYGLDERDYRFRIHDAILEFADDVKNMAPTPGQTREEFERELDRYNVKFYVNGERIR